jgi:phosphoglycolate phosphatase
MDSMKVLLFDIDGTLIDAGGAGQAAMEAAMDQQFGARQQVSGISTAGRTDRAIAVDLFEFHGVEFNDANWARYLSSYFQLLPDALHRHRGDILPGVEALMTLFGGREDLVLGLLTGNFAQGAKLKLGHYGLESHFAFGGFGDHHLDRDDVAREALKTVCAQVPGVAASEIWVIGDTPSDIRCGRAIGANVLAVATGMFSAAELEEHKPDFCLSDFSQPDEWLLAAGIR